MCWACLKMTEAVTQWKLRMRTTVLYLSTHLPAPLLHSFTFCTKENNVYQTDPWLPNPNMNRYVDIVKHSSHILFTISLLKLKKYPLEDNILKFPLNLMWNNKSGPRNISQSTLVMLCAVLCTWNHLFALLGHAPYSPRERKTKSWAPFLTK